MGGTTAKAGLIENGEVRIAPGQEVGTGMNMSRLLTGGGYFIGAATVDLAEVGAGGGSLVRLDANNVLKVGPESAGAVPGPICYGKGGDRVTITDANVLLNRIPADHFLGGKHAPRYQASARHRRRATCHAAWRSASKRSARPSSKSPTPTCSRCCRIVSVEQGYDPQDFCLIPSGGSGPVHAVELAEELGISEVIVPPAPGLLSSQGLLSADVRYDFRRTFVASVTDADLAALAGLIGELREEGVRSLSEYELSRRSDRGRRHRRHALSRPGL